jgi:hypothetical protein
VSEETCGPALAAIEAVEGGLGVLAMIMNPLLALFKFIKKYFVYNTSF